MSNKNNRKVSAKTNTAIVFLLCWFICAGIQVWLLKYFGEDGRTAWTDAAVSYLLLAAFCLFIISNT